MINVYDTEKSHRISHYVHNTELYSQEKKKENYFKGGRESLYIRVSISSAMIKYFTLRVVDYSRSQGSDGNTLDQ